MRVEEVTPESVHDEWHTLALKVGATPFARPEWVRQWWDAFGNGAERGVIAVRDERRRLTAALPFHRRRSVIALPQNDHAPVLPLVALDDAAAARALDALIDSAGHLIIIGRLVAGGPYASVTRAVAKDRGWHVLRVARMESPILDLPGFVDPLECLPQRKRSDMRRHERRFHERGRAEVIVTTDAGNVDALINECFSLEDRQWKGAAGVSMVSRPQTAAYYRGIANLAAIQGALSLVQVRLDGALIAFGLDVVGPDAHYGLKTGYDRSFANLGPGQMVVRAELTALADAGGGRFEFLGALDAYKQVWTQCRAVRDDLLLFRRTPIGLAQAFRLRGIPALRRRAQVIWAAARPALKR